MCSPRKRRISGFRRMTEEKRLVHPEIEVGKASVLGNCATPCALLTSKKTALVDYLRVMPPEKCSMSRATFSSVECSDWNPNCSSGIMLRLLMKYLILD